MLAAYKQAWNEVTCKDELVDAIKMLVLRK